MHTYSLSKNSGIFINFEVGTTNNIHRKFHKYRQDREDGLNLKIRV